MIRSKVEGKLDLTPHLQQSEGISVSQAIANVKSAWVSEANSRLNTTAKDYIAAMRVRVHKGASGVSASLYLDDDWARKLEYGFPSYDMKPLFAQSGKKKMGQDNQWYLHIPFRHTSPAATGKTGKNMPSSVYRKASAMPQWGRMASNKSASTSEAGYERKADIYDGMTKVPESATSTRSAYMTWRTVSENSDPIAWIHPGFKGVHIIEDLAPYVHDTFSQVFEANAQHILGNNRG